MNPNRSFWLGRRVLLTGHTGFKGAWLLCWLRRLGAETTGLSLAPTTWPALWSLLDLEPQPGEISDIRDLALVRRRFEVFQPEVVIHMAAQALVQTSHTDPVGTFATNVMGAANVLEASRSTPSVRAIVSVTSDKCYENVGALTGLVESDPLGGSDPYSASKACAELVAQAYRRSFFEGNGRLALASARAGNVVGGGDWAANRLVPDALQAFQAGRPLNVRNPASVRPWQHVLDPLCGYLLLVERLYKEGGAFAEAWNFGPDPAGSRSAAQIADGLVRAWGKGAAWVHTPSPLPQEERLLTLDSNKAQARLGWRTRLDIDAVLDWTVAWSKAVSAGATASNTTLDQIAAFEALAPTPRGAA